MSNELTDVRCPCGAEFQADSYDAGFIAGSGMCQSCDAALPPKDICTCPSGDGSLVHPCPAHPAAEQAGGDERAAFEYWASDEGLYPKAVERAGNCYKLAQTQSYWMAWQARAALAQPSPAPDLDPLNLASHAKAFNEAPAEALKPEQAEAERPEMSSERAAYFMRRFKSEEKLLGPNEQAAVDYVLSLIAQHERIVGALRFERQQMDRAFTACINERDAANARLHEVATACATAEQERDAALARVAELEKQEPVATVAKVPGEDWNSLDFHRELQDMHPGTKLYAAPVAQAQPEETPGEILAAKLIETWVTKHGKPAPWSTAVEITALATNMPNDERDRLLALDDDVDAQAQHSVPEGWRIERSAERIVVMNLNNGAGYAAARNGESGIAESVLYLLAADLLAAAPGKEGV